MQLSTRNGYGTVSINTGTNRVRGTSALADWTQGIAGSSWFTLVGAEETVYTVQALQAPATPTASGQWELLLDGIFSLPSVVAAEYAIHKDFTPNRHLPLFDPGDVQRSQIWNRAMWILDADNSVAAGVAAVTTLAFPTLGLSKPRLIPKTVVVEGTTINTWWILEAGAPDSAVGDVATIDDSGSRFRQLG